MLFAFGRLWRGLRRSHSVPVAVPVTVAVPVAVRRRVRVIGRGRCRPGPLRRRRAIVALIPRRGRDRRRACGWCRRGWCRRGWDRCAGRGRSARAGAVRLVLRLRLRLRLNSEPGAGHLALAPACPGPIRRRRRRARRLVPAGRVALSGWLRRHRQTPLAGQAPRGPPNPPSPTTVFCAQRTITMVTLSVAPRSSVSCNSRSQASCGEAPVIIRCIS